MLCAIGEKMGKRQSISAKFRLEVLKRDNYTCRNCGKSPAKYHELELDVVELEIDHVRPVSKGDDNRLDNLQTLCLLCNRGKGNNQQFNITIKEKVLSLINTINPVIIAEIEKNKSVKIVANENDFQELSRLLELTDSFLIDVIPNTISGFHAGHNLGIYTLKDNYGSKVNFLLKLNESNRDA
jgi:hypothetical protein